MIIDGDPNPDKWPNVISVMKKEYHFLGKLLPGLISWPRPMASRQVVLAKNVEGFKFKLY